MKELLWLLIQRHQIKKKWSKKVDKQHLDCIYDEEPLGFKKDLMAPERMQPRDSLEEIDLGEKGG